MKSTVTIGRSSHCDIIIPHDRISREHARISVVGGRYVYEDVGKNGSVIGGRIIHGERITIAPGAEVLLAGKVPLPWAQIYAMLPLKGVNPYSDGTKIEGGMAVGLAHPSYQEEGIGVGYGILAFLIPLAGFIMYFVWKDDKPKRASQACTIAWISFGINILFALANL